MSDTGIWECEREIGSGAFGLVTLWLNKSTGEKVVIKQIKKVLDAKNHQRWLEEIHLMNTIRHKNVVAGIPIPKQVEQHYSKAPERVLGLEFCDGSLRELLGVQNHCCGLPEKTVLKILQDVSCGLECLHKKRIVHRDLKPENILLSHRGETVFKITDLGYAKVLDANSIANSVVGTPQYWAPELLFSTSSGYTYTADFWSLGILIFECVTGHRPFLLTNKALEWAKYLRQKTDEQIWGYYSEQENDVKFSTEIPSPNHMCKPFLFAFRDWLQIVLRYDPKHRGNVPIEQNGTSECAMKIQEILSMRIVNVFNVLSCKTLSYVCRRGDTGATLKRFIHIETNIETQNQILIFPDTRIELQNDVSLEATCEKTQTIFLYNQTPNAKSDYNPTLINIDKVRELIGSPEEKRRCVELRPFWAHALYYCLSKASEFALLLQSEKLFMEYIEEKWSRVKTEKESVQRTAIRLESTVQLFDISYQCDLSYQPEQYGDAGTDCLAEWETLSGIVSSLATQTNLDLVYQNIDNVQTKLKTLQSKLPVDNELDAIAIQAGQKYDRLRKNLWDPKYKDHYHNSTYITQLVWSCMQKSEDECKTFYHNLKKMMDLDKELSFSTRELEITNSQLKDNISRVQSHQKARQGFVWKLMSSPAASGSDRPTSFSSSSLPEVLEQKLEESLPPNDDLGMELINREFQDCLSKLDQLIGIEKPKLGTRKSYTIDNTHETFHLDNRRCSMPVNLESPVRVAPPPQLHQPLSVQHNQWSAFTGQNPKKAHLERTRHVEEPTQFKSGQTAYVNPTNAYVNPTNAYVNPTNAYVNPTNAYVNQTNAYVNPTNAYVNQTNAYVNPTNAYVNPTNAYANPPTTAAGNYPPVTSSYLAYQQQTLTQHPPRIPQNPPQGIENRRINNWVGEQQPPNITNVQHCQLGISATPSPRASPTYNHSPRVSPNNPTLQDQQSFSYSTSPRRHTLTHTIGERTFHDAQTVRK